MKNGVYSCGKPLPAAVRIQGEGYIVWLNDVNNSRHRQALCALSLPYSCASSKIFPELDGLLDKGDWLRRFRLTPLEDQARQVHVRERLGRNWLAKEVSQRRPAVSEIEPDSVTCFLTDSEKVRMEPCPAATEANLTIL